MEGSAVDCNLATQNQSPPLLVGLHMCTCCSVGEDIC